MAFRIRKIHDGRFFCGLSSSVWLQFVFLHHLKLFRQHFWGLKSRYTGEPLFFFFFKNSDNQRLKLWHNKLFI